MTSMVFHSSKNWVLLGSTPMPLSFANTYGTSSISLYFCHHNEIRRTMITEAKAATFLMFVLSLENATTVESKGTAAGRSSRKVFHRSLMPKLCSAYWELLAIHAVSKHWLQVHFRCSRYRFNPDRARSRHGDQLVSERPKRCPLRHMRHDGKLKSTHAQAVWIRCRKLQAFASYKPYQQMQPIQLSSFHAVEQGTSTQHVYIYSAYFDASPQAGKIS